MQQDGWAWRDRNGNPAPLETDDIRRVTNNWPEYGGIVIGARARERHPDDYDPETVQLDPDRAVFDIEMLREVGRVQRERTVKKTNRGQPAKRAYPLAGLIYCAHCEAMAAEQGDPKLRSKLSGTLHQRYRHKPGVPCGCKNKSILRETLEADFIGLVKALTVTPQTIERIKTLALHAGKTKDEQELIEQKEAGIARCQRRIEAARNLYSDGDIDRDEYMQRKLEAENEIRRWEAMDIDAERQLAELTMAMDVVNKLGSVWDGSSEDDQQGLAKTLFESVVYDLDTQRIVDFSLKSWAEEFFVVNVALACSGEAESNVTLVGKISNICPLSILF